MTVHNPRCVLDPLHHRETPCTWFSEPPPLTREDQVRAARLRDWLIHGPTASNMDHLILTTVHGDPAIAREGDWVIRDAKSGTFYPCKPDIFAATYEPVEPAPSQDATGAAEGEAA